MAEIEGSDREGNEPGNGGVFAQESVAVNPTVDETASTSRRK